MKTFIPFFLVIFWALAGCEKNSTTQSISEPLVIKAGYDCGWGAGDETMVITSSEITYQRIVPMESNVPKISKKRAIGSAEWNDLQNDLNFPEFQKLTYNTCNICVDGCDEWIEIQKNGTTHKITYGKGLAIPSIQKLQQKINGLREEFSR